MQRKKSFLVVCISILTGAASAQTRPALVVDKIIFAPQFRPFIKPPAAVTLQPLSPATPPPFRLSAVQGDYYSTHLGFFCKQELEVQKFTHLPVFFRLGSLEYCNKLDGK